MRNTHEAINKNTKVSNEKEMRENFIIFENFLASLAQNFYDTTDKIDFILKETKLENFDEAIALLIHPQQSSYFFYRLNNPDWIEPLEKKGFFKNPPSVIHNSSEEYPILPNWPESQYLAKMAEYDSSTVFKIINSIETENPRIQANFVDGVLKIPCEKVVELIPKIQKWIKSPYIQIYFPLSEKIALLSVNLAKGKQYKKAIELARSLLNIQDIKLENNQDKENLDDIFEPLKNLDNYFNPLKNSDYQCVKAKLTNWQYQQILTKYIPELVTETGKDALSMLCELLYNAVKIYLNIENNKKSDNSLILDDESIYWWRSIAEHTGTFFYHGVLTILAVAVRDAAEQLIKNDHSEIRAIVSLLKKKKWLIFHRIALYLIYKFPEADFQLIGEELADSKYFDNSPYHNYEYIVLIKEHFSSISLEKQNKIFAQIANPNFDWPWEEDPEKKKQYLKQWQYQRLTPFKDSLPANWQQSYEQLVQEFGLIELSELYSGGLDEVRIGLEYPKTASDLTSMSNEELISFVKTWNSPNRGYFDASPNGLASELKKVAEKDPERFALMAVDFQEINQKYGCNILQGLGSAINNRRGREGELKQLSWSSMFQLCQWIVEESQSFRQPEVTDSNLFLDWGESRRTVAYFLQISLSAEEPLKIPFDFRNEIWKILELLTKDPEPTLEYEKSFSMKPSNLSINTVREQAMHAVMHYALWIRRYFEKMPDGKQLIEQGFDAMPEVRDTLDFHLNFNQDSSIAIRSVYGRWLPWLTLLDQKWTKVNIEKFFPQDIILSDVRRVTWESYLKFCPFIYDNVFDVLNKEYHYQLELINTNNIKIYELKESERYFVNHIMTLYWRGKINLNEPQGLLTLFYTKANDTFFGRGMGFLGESLRDTEKAIPSDILERLYLLWENRIYNAKNSSQPTLHTQEMAAFGLWFLSGKLDDSWAIEQVKEVLLLVHKIELDFQVVKRLAILSDSMSKPTFECIKLLIEKNSNICFQLNEVKKILANAIGGDNIAVKQEAVDLVHKLGELGSLEFRELLN